ncbi:universal stress protein [Nocardioides conyzicola]|uniref:Universal stress protein n=1 Tax=Nocardioides conyzicola TaxID=1651781 RepID=A0ABP8X6R8_9ACTN
MDTPRPVVVAVGRRGSGAALEYAALECLRRGVGLHVVHAAGPGEGDEERMRDGAAVVAAALDGVADLLPARVPVTSTLALSAAVPAVVAAATEAPLVVVGRCPESRWTHPYVRSVTGGVAARVPSPVVSVPDDWPGGTPRVVVGVDDPEDSAEVLLEAFAAACALGARLTVVSTWWRAPGTGDRALSQVEDRARSEHLSDAIERALADLRPAYDDVPVEVQVRNARPGEALIETSAGAALCVLGRHDPLLPVGSRLGPVARSVLREASCPVLLAAPRHAHRVHSQQARLA